MSEALHQQHPTHEALPAAADVVVPPMQPEQLQASSFETEGPGMKQFSESLDALAEKVPEVQNKKEVIKATTAELAATFELNESFFESPDRCTIMAAVADRWSNMGTSPESSVERDFLADCIALMGYKFSPALEDAKKHIERESSPLGEAAQAAAYEKYTDTELSAEVTEAINNGMLADVKEKLGVTSENEDDYEVRVLSISDNSQTHGISAPQLHAESVDMKTPEGKAYFKENIQTREAVENWKQGLVKRSGEFAAALGRDGLFGPAWVTEVNGKRALCITMPLAEKLLHKETTENAPYYDEAAAARDRAIIEHEYVHTQGGLSLDKELAFGINLEELRAEHFSGNKQGYQDIKGFFRDYQIITGHSVAEGLEGKQKGGTASDVYADIAAHVGLDKMLEVVMASPQNYIESQSNTYIREAYDYIGGFDGVLSRLMEQEIANGNGPRIEAEIEKAAQTVIEVTSRDGAVLGVDDIAAYRKRYGLNVITDLITKKAHDIKDQAETDAPVYS